MYIFTKMHLHKGGRGRQVGSGLVPTANADSCEGSLCEGTCRKLQYCHRPGENRAVGKGTSKAQLRDLWSVPGRSE